MLDLAYIKDQIKRIRSAGSSLEKVALSLDLQAEAYSQCDGLDCSYMKKIAEQAYIHAISAATHAQEILATLPDENKEYGEISPSYGEEEPIPFELVFDEEFNIFSCKIRTPPILKTHIAGRKFYTLFCMELERKIIEKKPDNFPQIHRAHVFFISHFDASKPIQKQVYFDNDNLAIKGIWDAIIPNICFDDAAKFCNNIYLAQPDTDCFCEIAVIPQGQLEAWLMRNSMLDFAKEFINQEEEKQKTFLSKYRFFRGRFKEVLKLR